MSRKLDDLFESKICTFASEIVKFNTGEHFQRHVVIWKDLADLIQRTIGERNIDVEKMLITIRLDGGGGFMKICVSVDTTN